MTLAAQLLAAMVALAPPERLAALPQWPGWEETAAEKRERYASIAEDVAAVVAEDPKLGPRGRARAASVLLSISYLESGWSPDVDRGPCYRAGTSSRRRCDGGRSAGIWQTLLDDRKTTARAHGIAGLTQADLFADRRQAARVALYMVRRSFLACSHLGEWARLNQYASGRCELGQSEGRARLVLADKIFARMR